ncbi:protocadherin Fat 3-like [Mya arenaria]|uniref:protocadherin Fat 3-like n=1 Tax=Mya arenaria TaxID=6604 RepID=UPI0022E29123|nr:protocadherin Fat 3-like [Mya arenaria]
MAEAKERRTCDRKATWSRRKSAGLAIVWQHDRGERAPDLRSYGNIAEAIERQLCSDNTDVGNVGRMENFDDGGPEGMTDAAFVVISDEITCCGLLDEFEAYVEFNTAEFHYQIWRPSGSGYTLIGDWSQTCNNGECDYNLPNSAEITVHPGDLFGWYTPGADTMKYDTRGGGAGENYIVLSIPSLTNGTAVNWSNSGTLLNSREYPFGVRLDRNNKPFFNDLNNDESTQTTIIETVAVSTSIWRVEPDDNDVSDPPFLTVVMAANTYFTYDPTTNNVNVAASLVNIPSPQTLFFTVTDQCGNEETRRLTVNILNIPPVIQNLPNATTIHENTNDVTYLYTVDVIDTDVVTCVIQSVNPPTTATAFSLSQSGGSSQYWDLATTANCYFDYKSSTNHQLTIRCTDTDGDKDDETFTVSLTPNQPPEIHNLNNSTDLHEDVDVETFLYQLNVTDGDSPSIDCYFTNPSSKFRLRQVTGGTAWGIYTIAGTSFDYNAQNAYPLDVTCTDERDTDTGRYTVYLIRNDPPQLTNVPANISLSTSAPIGYNVYTVTSYDPPGPGGVQDQVWYYISCSPSTCPFTILASGHLELNAGIEELSLVGYDVNITVCDHRNCGLSRILTVTIVDINDIPMITNLNQAFNVPENSNVGTTVVTAACTDFDVPDDTITFSMTCSPAGGTSLFSINVASGVIFVNSEISHEALGIPTFSCSVTCSDGQAMDTASLDLVVTDINEQPKFSQYAYSVTKDEGPKDTPLLSAPNVNDPDTVESLTFTLDCGAHTGYFSIDGNTGALSYASDYDVDPAGGRPQNVMCELKVTDKGGLTDTATIDITIKNINDNAPVFQPASYTYFADWNSPASTQFLTPNEAVSATDGDLGDYGKVTYRLDQAALGGEYFGISQTGSLYVISSLQPLGYGATVDFEIIATDGGGTERRAPVSVVIMTSTTQATTTTTDRYRTFFEDSRNLVWFVVAIILVICVAVAITYMICTYCLRSPPSLTKLACRC